MAGSLMKSRTLAGAVLLLLAALVVAGCGKPIEPRTHTAQVTPNLVVTLSDDFQNHSLSITTGQLVNFFDPATAGGTHVLCLGRDETCDTKAHGPEALRGQGFTINAGDSLKSVQFDIAGTYQITCSVHPHMNLTVTVH